MAREEGTGKKGHVRGIVDKTRNRLDGENKKGLTFRGLEEVRD